MKKMLLVGALGWMLFLGACGSDGGDEVLDACKDNENTEKCISCCQGEGFDTGFYAAGSGGCVCRNTE